MGPLRRRVLAGIGIIGMVASTLVVTTTSARADDDDDPLCYTTRSTSGQFYAGPSASRVYDWVDVSSQTTRRFHPGAPIPAGLLDEHYVPQGIAAWPNWDGTGEDLILVSAYKDEDGDGTTDGASGVWGVVIGGSRSGTSLGRMLIAEGHVGGIGVYKGWLYVGSESEIRGYRLSKVRDALQGANTNTVYARDYNRASSYVVGFMGTGDGHLWAGDFDESSSQHLNGYVQTSSSTGAISYVSSTQVYAPKKTQGVAVTANHVIFSTSYGRNDRGNLWVMPRGQDSLSDGNSYCFRAPSMNQGVTILGDRLYVGFESAAYTYNKGLDDPDNPIDHLHYSSLSDVTGLYGGGILD
ncbi:hypothetical protein [Terrabacter sp. MAHUQ-38]|uniref:hypothetical protein n=1 Tax=unclassified Terrabacter TaxID=2630222 RepID=UPI00165E22B4|nr:hypothetical protein [Terrabacter sp. MAHUQ-38]MBC9821382.1 hypothetical protein [Terrabacter sp. MAHUQ-38]